MKTVLKNVLWYYFLFFVSLVCVMLFGNLLLATVMNAIFGAEIGMPLTGVVMNLMIPPFTYLLIFFAKAKDAAACREYLRSVEGEETYDRATDRKRILRGKKFRQEVVVTLLVGIPILILLFATGTILFLVFFPLFDFLVTLWLHRRWHTNRMRK